MVNGAVLSKWVGIVSADNTVNNHDPYIGRDTINGVDVTDVHYAVCMDTDQIAYYCSTLKLPKQTYVFEGADVYFDTSTHRAIANYIDCVGKLVMVGDEVDRVGCNYEAIKIRRKYGLMPN
ncbi:MAG: hypothetical protein IJ803_09295 [Oribacterium sp.]|nr:hypothetical protein [Oribacterium sp.]